MQTLPNVKLHGYKLWATNLQVTMDKHIVDSSRPTFELQCVARGWIDQIRLYFVILQLVVYKFSSTYYNVLQLHPQRGQGTYMQRNPSLILAPSGVDIYIYLYCHIRNQIAEQTLVLFMSFGYDKILYVYFYHSTLNNDRKKSQVWIASLVLDTIQLHAHHVICEKYRLELLKACLQYNRVPIIFFKFLFPNNLFYNKHGILMTSRTLLYPSLYMLGKPFAYTIEHV